MQQPLILTRRPAGYAYWAVLGALAAAGLAALAYRLAAGLRVTDLGSVVPWGLWISFYILFIGLSAGSFLLSTLVYVFGLTAFERIGRLAIYTAAIALVMGMTFVAVDLGHPERFWHIFTSFSQSSVMWYESMLYIVYVVILAAELWFLSRDDLVRLRETAEGARRRFYALLALRSDARDASDRATDMRVVRLLALIGLPVAISVHGGTGAIFAVVKAVPYWYSPLLPIVFITSAMVSGAGLLLFFRAFLSEPESEDDRLLPRLATLALGLLAIDWILVVSEVFIGLYGGIPGHDEAVREVLTGPNWWVFWLVQVGLGVAVPAIIITTQRSRAWLGAAGGAIVLGIVGVRWNIVIPGLTVPKLTGLPDALTSGRLTTAYTPTWVEWLISIGLVALFFLLLSAGNALLPLRSGEQQVEHASGN